jgi:hypothetical protein
MDFLKNIENTIENTIENMLNNYTEQDLVAGFKKSRTQSDEEYCGDDEARKSSVHRTQPLRWTDSLVENTENDNDNEQDLENPARKSDEEYSDDEKDLENPARKAGFKKSRTQSDEEYSDNEQDLEYSSNNKGARGAEALVKGARESSVQRAEPSRGAEIIITEPKSSDLNAGFSKSYSPSLSEISNTLKKYVRTISKVNIPETIPESIQEFALENISENTPSNTPSNIHYNTSHQLMPFTPKRNPDHKPDGSKPDGSKPDD